MYITGAEENMVVWGWEVRGVVKKHLLHTCCITGLFCSSHTEIFQVFQLLKLFPTTRPLSLGVGHSPLPSLHLPILHISIQLSPPPRGCPNAIDKNHMILLIHPTHILQFSFMVSIVFVTISQFTQLLTHCLPPLDCGDRRRVCLSH